MKLYVQSYLKILLTNFAMFISFYKHGEILVYQLKNLIIVIYIMYFCYILKICEILLIDLGVK